MQPSNLLNCAALGVVLVAALPASLLVAMRAVLLFGFTFGSTEATVAFLAVALVFFACVALRYVAQVGSQGWLLRAVSWS